MRTVNFRPVAKQGWTATDKWIGWALAASLWGHHAGNAETKAQNDATFAAQGAIDELFQFVKTQAKRPDSAIPQEDDLTENVVRDVVRDEGSALQRFEDLVKRAQRELLDAMDAKPITALAPEWTAETRTVRLLLRKRAEDLAQFRDLCAKVRARLAQLVIQIQGAADSQAASNALPLTADECIMKVTRELFSDQYNGLVRTALQQLMTPSW